ncbi:transcriptional regulator, partial [Mycobacterium tuberculosis]
MKKKPNKQLLEMLSNMAEGLGQTFAPFCEVVVHDLSNPKNAIHAIENSLSGREVGESVTELGLARIRDPGFPAVIANYANTFPDGRKVKSTSIGIKDESGEYVAALCLNVDLTLFQSFQGAISQ